jgi:hypothetical protein
MNTRFNNIQRPLPSGKRRLTLTPYLALLAVGVFATSAHAALLIDYNFDEGSGTAVNNSGTLGDAADGTLTGSFSTNTPSGSGSSVQFSGSDATQGVSTSGVVAGLNGLSQVTGVLWLNLTAAPSVSDRLISNSSTNNGFDLTVIGVSGGNFTLALNTDNAVGTASSSISQNLNNWQFIAFTYDGTQTSNNLQFYLGTTSSSVAALGGAKTNNSGALGTSTNPFQVGNTALTDLDRTPPALFDNVRIYDTVLDSTQLEAIRVATIPEPSTWASVAFGAAFLSLRRRNRLATK